MDDWCRRDVSCAGPEDLGIISRHLAHGTKIPFVLPMLFNQFINLGDDTSALSANTNLN